MLFKTLATLSLFGYSQAVIQRYCALFDASSSSGETSNITVSTPDREIAVLVAHISDIRDSHLWELDLDVLQTLPSELETIMYDGVEIRRDEVCLAERIHFFDLDRILNPIKIFSITDRLINAQESATHVVDKEGIYCAFAYQDEPDGLNNVTFFAEHWSAAHPLTSNQHIKVSIALCFVTLLHEFVFPALIRRPEHSFYRSQGFSSSMSFASLGKLFMFSAQYVQTIITGSKTTLLTNRWSLIDFTLSLLTISIMYRILTVCASFMWSVPKLSHPDTYSTFTFNLGSQWCIIYLFSVFVPIYDTSIGNLPLRAALLHDFLPALFALQLSLGFLIWPYFDNKAYTSDLNPLQLTTEEIEDIRSERETCKEELCGAALGACMFAFGIMDAFLSEDESFAILTERKGLPRIPRIGTFQDMRLVHVHVLRLDRWLRFF